MRLQYDSEHNALRLMLDEETASPSSRDTVRGLVDVAANGRLVGIELQTGQDTAQLSRMLDPWSEDPVAGEFVSLEDDGTAYIELTTGEADEHSRASEVELVLELDDTGRMLAVSIPRRGEGYEISYPSGNQ